MSQPVLRHLRRVQAFWGRPSEDAEEAPSSPPDSETPEKVRRLLRVLLKNPWDDYSYIRNLGQTTLALRKASSFQLADIREVPPFEVLGDPPILPQIKHSNIVAIKELYCYDDKIFLVTEHLDVSFAQLNCQKYDLEEREIATILTEVLKGVAHISSLRLSCKNLSQEDIRLSLNGDIKLGWWLSHIRHIAFTHPPLKVLDPQQLRNNDLYESPKVSQVLLDFPILAEIIEEMMLSRYHLTADDEKWSKDALDFLSCTLEGSFESLMNHCFLEQAVSPRRLIPRIRFAYETELGSWSSESDKKQAFDFDCVTSA